MAILQRGARLGAYIVDELIAAGGMAEVYIVKNGRDERFAAKVPRLSGLSDATCNEWRARFQREAVAVRALRHRAIVELVDVSPDAAAPYYVMEYLDGMSAIAWGRKHGATLVDWLRVGIEVANGLGEAHACQVLHRDVKAENILISGGRSRRFGGRVKLIDWGVAKWPGAATLTVPGEVLGTPGSMDPAVLRKQADYSPQSDLYALGSFLYFAMLGVRHLGADVSWEANEENRVIAPRAIDRKFPPAVETLLLSLLADSPAKRPRSAKAIAGKIGLLVDELDAA